MTGKVRVRQLRTGKGEGNTLNLYLMSSPSNVLLEEILFNAGMAVIAMVSRLG